MKSGLFFVVLLFVGIVTSQIIPKQLAGPPSEFGLHYIPAPLQQALSSSSARLSVNVWASEADDTKVVWESSLPVDSTNGFQFSVFTPSNLITTLIDPNGDAVDLSKYATAGYYILGDDGTSQVPVTDYILSNTGTTFPAGIYTLKIESECLSAEEKKRYLENEVHDGLIFVQLPSSFESLAYLDSYNLIRNTPSGIVAQLYDTSLYGRFNGTLPTAKRNVDKGVLFIEEPNGKNINVPMNDDGEWPDAIPGDGIFGGAFTPNQDGNYIVTTELTGIDDSGNPFVRTTDHLFQVITANVTLTGSASAVIDNVDNLLNFTLGVTVQGTPQILRGYAEVYGTDSNGQIVPVAWIGGVVPLQTSGDSSSVVMTLNLSWLTLADASAPFTLQNVYIADMASSVPMTQASTIQVDTSSLTGLEEVLATVAKPTEITKEMRNGKTPARFAKAKEAKDASKQQVVFVHGYCSEQNPWQQTGDFPDTALYFLNPKANLDNDAFARLVQEFTKGVDAFSAVAHSQGGMVITHLYNYYFTGLQGSSAPRVLQSVGTPYQGNSGAGSAADLINIFGVGCGANPSLTKDGAALWLSGITSDTRAEVFFFTTQYPEGLFNFCQAGVGLVLDQPNDGTTELPLAPLEGANNMGNVEGECHTSSMRYEPQCYDDSRNKDIWANANV